MTVKKPERYQEIYGTKDGKPDDYLVMKIDREKRESTYYIRGNHAKHISKITLEGILGFPPGLYLNKNGFGFKDSYYFLEVLRNQFPEECSVELIVMNNGKPHISGRKNVKVKIPISDLQELLAGTWQITTEASRDKRVISGSFLSTLFPEHISLSEADFGNYESGAVAEALGKKGVLEKMNENDLEALVEFLPKIFDPKTKFKVGVNKLKEFKLRIADDQKKLSEKIYLEEVIKEFEKMLVQTTISEQKWQDLLRDKVFPFNTSYIKIIEKQNIDIGVSLPDFLLVDVYGFIDIYEIKTHYEKLLTYDSSHDNYCWSSAMSKAIAQAEKYVKEIERNAAEIESKLRKKHGMDFEIVRPRAYVIAGTSSQLDTSAKREAFRLLRRSHKNVEFLLYDELFGNLKQTLKLL